MGCYKLIRFTFYFFNILLCLLALASLGVGIWMAVDGESFLELTKLGDVETVSPDLVRVSGYIMIGAGAVTTLLVAIGILGACKNSACLLGLYISVLVLAMAVQVAAVVLGVVFRKDIEDKLDDKLQEKINKEYEGPISGNANAFTSAWNTLMEEAECCGVRNATQDFMYTLNWDRNDTGILQHVPSTCCVGGNDDCGAMPNSTNHYTEGCLTKVKDLLHKYHAVVIGVSSGIVAFQLLMVVMGVYLLSNHKRPYKMGGKD